jgi:hypothetical protein
MTDIAKSVRCELPSRLDRDNIHKLYAEILEPARKLYNSSYTFTWGEVRWAELGDSLQLLAFATHLIRSGNEVIWDLRCQRPDHVETLRFNADAWHADC